MIDDESTDFYEKLIRNARCLTEVVDGLEKKKAKELAQRMLRILIDNGYSIATVNYALADLIGRVGMTTIEMGAYEGSQETHAATLAAMSWMIIEQSFYEKLN